MLLVLAILIAALIVAVLKVLSYYFALAGVLYHLEIKYNDELSTDEIMKLATEAAKHIS